MSLRILAIVALCVFFASLASAQVLPTPTNLTATEIPSPSGGPTVGLSWQAPIGMWMYNIYRSTGDTLHFQRISMSFALTYNDHQVNAGSTYYYYVTSATVRPDSTIQESPRSNVAWITLATRPAGTISGTVTDSVTGLPIRSALVQFFRTSPNGTVPLQAYTDAQGRYSAVVDTGVYKIKADGRDSLSHYGVKWFDNKTNFQNADPVVVTVGGTSTANFQLKQFVPPPRVRGTIAGTVIDDATQLPIACMFIRFYSLATPPRYHSGAMTNTAGHYEALLDTGVYLIKAESMPNGPGILDTSYRTEWFDNAPDPQHATPVRVIENATFTANFGLQPLTPATLVHVRGVVTDTLGHPLAHAGVAIMRSLQDMASLFARTGSHPGLGPESFIIPSLGLTRGVRWFGYTDSLGRYDARVAADQSYIALASKSGYLPEYFFNKTTPQTADIILVTRDTSGINFSLAPRTIPQNSIAGIVRDSLGTRVPSRVILYPVLSNPGGNTPQFGHTDSMGAYIIQHVVAGKYFVQAFPFSGFGPAYYKAGAYGVTRRDQADTVNIVGNVTGIDIGVRPVLANGLTTISGRARTLSGSPLNGVNVAIHTAEGELVGVGVTDGSGAYSLEAVVSGSLGLTVDRVAYNNSQLGVTVGSNVYTMTNVDVTLAPSSPTSVSSEGDRVPTGYTLEQNYPNPFNPSTAISFALPVAGRVTLTVFDMLGREVRTLVNEELKAGSYKTTLNASDLASGVYLYRLQSGKFVETKKLMLLR